MAALVPARRCIARSGRLMHGAAARHALIGRRSNSSGGPVSTEYLRQVDYGSVRLDDAQVGLAVRLDALHASLASTDLRVLPEESLTVDHHVAPRRESFPTPLHSAAAVAAHALRRTFVSAIQPSPPRGLYVHGSVGVGKSYLMDMFYDACGEGGATARRKRRRAHFHEFMLDVHGRIHEFKKGRPRDDPIPPVALDLARQARLLCFDEFQITDIADAMIVKRLFEMLFDAGVVMVSTSNRPPEALYEGGLNRSLFLPFVDTLRSTCDVVSMDGTHDYRRDGAAAAASSAAAGASSESYFWPAGGPGARSALDEIFSDSGGGRGGEEREESVPVMMGRSVRVSRANDHCGRFDFMELCHRPLGAADYIAICSRFPVVIVENVPQLGGEHYNEARRFVTFIDALYEARTRLVVSAEVPLEELFVDFDATVETNDGDEEMAVAKIEGKEQRTRSSKESAIQNQRGDEETWVSGEGGSSSSASTTMVRTRDGNVEWSATGRVGVSLAQLSAVRDVSFSFRRAKSRLVEMSGKRWLA
uniref:AAA+ ATPase domain-containing protein n=1 Tax=Odontella aurita TaxID=265563 RepID=A0A7S4IGS0_9STRA